MRTIVNANRQVFANDFTAAGAHLRRLPGVNLYNRPTSFLRFEGRVLDQLSPGHIGDTLVHTTVITILHNLYVQVLEDYDLELIDQLSTNLVCKVPAAIGGALVDMLYDTPALAVFWRAFLARAQAALRLG
jgi:hypothetical protein